MFRDFLTNRREGFFRYPRPRASCACSILRAEKRALEVVRANASSSRASHRPRPTPWISTNDSREHATSAPRRVSFFGYVIFRQGFTINLVNTDACAARNLETWPRLRRLQRRLRTRTSARGRFAGTGHTIPLCSASRRRPRPRATTPSAFR